jgi:CHAD domain-containing protein
MLPGFNFSDQLHFQQSITETCQYITGVLISFANTANETPVESTHQIRKKLKLFRAFTKLVKLCSEQGTYSGTNHFLRDLGREFSGLRDAHVRSFLLQEVPHSGNSSGFTDLLNELITFNNSIINRIEKTLLSDDNRFQWFAEKLGSNTKLTGYFSNLLLSEEHILNAFTASFDKSRFAFQSGFIFPDSEMMHEWRKRMKDVQYQTELIAGELHTAEITFYPSVVMLCDYLGEMNDLHMLSSWATENQDGFQHSDDLKAWINELKYRKNVLQRQAEELGNELYQLSSAAIQDKMKSVIYE